MCGQREEGKRDKDNGALIRTTNDDDVGDGAIYLLSSSQFNRGRPGAAATSKSAFENNQGREKERERTRERVKVFHYPKVERRDRRKTRSIHNLLNAFAAM